MSVSNNYLHIDQGIRLTESDGINLRRTSGMAWSAAKKSRGPILHLGRAPVTYNHSVYCQVS
jgi:hypothetical protein